MTNDERKNWISSRAGDAAFAIRMISAAKKQRVSDYDERIRLLKDFIASLDAKRTDTQQLEMFDPGEVLTPLLKKFVNTPLAGLS